MLRVGFQSGITDRLDLRLFFEPARNLQCVRAMALHSQRERFQTSQHQKTIECACDRADRILQKPQSIGKFLAISDDSDSTDQSRRTVQILRRRMDDNIETEYD